MGVAGKGTQFRRWNGSGSWVKMAEVFAISGPNMSRTMIDDTTFDSADDYREFIAGIRDAGPVSLSMNFTRDEYEQAKADFEDDTKQNYEMILPDSDTTSLEFEALISDLPLDVPLDDKITCDVAFQISGKPTLNSGSGPSAGA